MTDPTPQAPLVPGNINLYNRPQVKNPDGTISTVRSMSFEENGKEILVPTVSDDGRIMTDAEARNTYHKTGKHLGIFPNADAATGYAVKLHNDYAAGKYMTDPTQIEGLPPGAVIRPLQGSSSQIEGLPEGAIVRPLGQASQPQQQAPQQPEEEPGMISKLGSAVAGAAGGVLSGIAKGAGDTVNTASKALHAIPGVGETLAPQQGIQAATQMEKPQGTAEHIGAGIESIGEFLLGDEALKGMSYAMKLKELAPVMSALEKFPKLTQAVMTGLRMGTTGTAQGLAHGESLPDAATQGAITGVLGGAGKAITAKPLHIDATEAAKAITDIVNPIPQHMTDFEANLTKQLPRIVDHIERGAAQGVEKGNVDRSALVKVLKSAADEHQDLYDKQILEPVKDKLGATGQTFGQMENRLRHLNKITNYIPSSKAETETQVALKAEAGALRKGLNEGIAKKLGLTPEQVAEARSPGEQLRDLADKTRLSINQERYAGNAADRGISLPTTKASMTNRVLTKGVQKLTGDADDSLRDVFSKIKTEKPEIAIPNVPKPQPSTRPIPAWQKPVVAEKPPGSTATIAEHLDAAKSRQQRIDLERGALQKKARNYKSAIGGQGY